MASPDRTDVEFKTFDGLKLRGWFYPVKGMESAPGIVVSHGWSCVKEMDLDRVAEKFQAAGIASLVYDQRNLGASEGTPRQEINPDQQTSDVFEAVTFLSTRPGVDASKIAVWGYSLSGGHAFKAAAVDRRIKAVITTSPALSFPKISTRLVPADLRAQIDAALLADRAARIEAGPDAEPTYALVTSKDPAVPSMMPMADAAEWFFRMHETKAPAWENRHTFQSLFHSKSFNPAGFIENLSPTPWLLVQADSDTLCYPDLNIALYEQAQEPKEIKVFPGGHFDLFSEGIFDELMATEIDFLKRKLNF